MTRSLLLYVPQLPIPLAEQFIRDRYRRILERKDWAGQRAEAEFLLNNQKIDGTVALTRGVNTVTGTATSFAATDVGRQFKAGGDSPIYTVATWASTTSITLDRVYGGATTTSTTYRIFDGYVTVPSDFLRFVSVVDNEAGFRLRHWITADEIASVDPQRTNFGQPYCLADRMFVNVAGIPTPQYEVWPYSTNARNLYYVYLKRPVDLINDSDTPLWPIRSDAIVAGALADAARWPGTPTEINPYYRRPELWISYEKEYEDKMIELERRDEDLTLTWLSSNDWASYPFYPWSAGFIQSHSI